MPASDESASFVMDKEIAMDRLRAALPTLPGHQRRALVQFLLGSNLTFLYVCDPQHRDAYRLFCRLISSGEAASPFCDHCTSLLAMTQEHTFEEFHKFVSCVVRGEKFNNIVGELAAKSDFRRMFRRLLQHGWLRPREGDPASCEMIKMLNAVIAYQDGCGPKPLCVVDDEGSVSFLEEDEKVFEVLNLHDPDSDAVEDVKDFFAQHPNATWKQASEALNMPVQRLKRLRKKHDGLRCTARGSEAATGAASSQRIDVSRGAEPQDKRECLKQSMSAETLKQTAYTRITFTNGTSKLFIFEPSLRGRVLWSEWVDSHPFPATPADFDSMLQRKWTTFSKSPMYQCHGPETVLGRLFHGARDAKVFGRAESQGLYRHDLQRALYELAVPWNCGEDDAVRAAQRIRDIGRELYEMGEDAGLSYTGFDGFLRICEQSYEATGRLPEGISAQQLINARRLYGHGHAIMVLHMTGLEVLTGVYDEVTKGAVPAARHMLPATDGDIVNIDHTQNLRSELEITGWRCVVEMLWHGIGVWEN